MELVVDIIMHNLLRSTLVFATNENYRRSLCSSRYSLPFQRLAPQHGVFAEFRNSSGNSRSGHLHDQLGYVLERTVYSIEKGQSYRGREHVPSSGTALPYGISLVPVTCLQNQQCLPAIRGRSKNMGNYHQ